VFVNANNLFVITKFSGFDPEVNIDKSQGATPSRSIEYIPYPTARTFSFGFKFTL
jgi:iron complex outermembrane receptor protein